MTLHFGVLLVDPRGLGVKFQDISPVGLIADLTKEYLTRSPPGPTVDRLRPFAIDLMVNYIADSLEPVRMTARVTVVPTDTYETCPTLDYLWIPGPSPMYQPSTAEVAFIRARYAERGIEGSSISSRSSTPRWIGWGRTGGWLMRRRSCGHVEERRRGLICLRRISRSISTLLWSHSLWGLEILRSGSRNIRRLDDVY